MKKVYIAAPFFNPAQFERVEKIKEILESAGVPYFSPKDESMFKQGDDPRYILDLNCRAIESCSCIIVVTDDKDVGTIWEAGYSFAIGKPIIYLWLGYKPEMKFNIMLAASGDVTVSNYIDLFEQIVSYKYNGKFKMTSRISDDRVIHE